MKRYPNINYQFRPASYWEDRGVLTALLRGVKGTERRKLIKQAWQEGNLEAIPEALLKNTLSEEERAGIGQIHPIFMGGEYLPDAEDGESEIVRIELRSTTSDVISIRAWRSRRLVHYRIVDEYETEFGQPRQQSRQPLTLAEVIAFIDGSTQPDYPQGLGLCFNILNAECGSDPKSLRHFTTVSSEFYPQLEEHYEHVYDDWVKAAESAAVPVPVRA